MPKFNSKRGIAGVKKGVKPLAKKSAKMVKTLAPLAIGGVGIKGAVTGAKALKTTAGRKTAKKAIKKGATAAKKGYAKVKDRVELARVRRQQAKNSKAYTKRYGR